MLVAGAVCTGPSLPCSLDAGCRGCFAPPLLPCRTDAGCRGYSAPALHRPAGLMLVAEAVLHLSPKLRVSIKQWPCHLLKDVL